MPLYAPLTMPDADRLLTLVLRPGLFNVAEVGTLAPPDLTDHLPFVVARCYGGTSADPRLVFRASCQVDTYAPARPTAYSVAEAARGALLAAWLNQTVTTSGSIAGFTVTGWPAEVRDPDAPSGLVRYSAQYALTIRPPR